jgi:hypothetical protein
VVQLHLQPIQDRFVFSCHGPPSTPPSTVLPFCVRTLHCRALHTAVAQQRQSLWLLIMSVHMSQYSYIPISDYSVTLLGTLHIITQFSTDNTGLCAFEALSRRRQIVSVGPGSNKILLALKQLYVRNYAQRHESIWRYEYVPRFSWPRSLLEMSGQLNLWAK